MTKDYTVELAIQAKEQIREMLFYKNAVKKTNLSIDLLHLLISIAYQ